MCGAQEVRTAESSETVPVLQTIDPQFAGKVNTHIIVTTSGPHVGKVDNIIVVVDKPERMT